MEVGGVGGAEVDTVQPGPGPGGGAPAHGDHLSPSHFMLPSRVYYFVWFSNFDIKTQQSPAQHVGGAAARHGAEAGPGPGHGGAGGVSQVWGGNISSLLTVCIESGQ